MAAPAFSGIVADGYERYTRSESFRARERETRLAVHTAFAPCLAAARTLPERWGLLWERRREVRRALRELRPSPHACFAVPPAGPSARPNPALRRTGTGG